MPEPVPSSEEEERLWRLFVPILCCRVLSQFHTLGERGTYPADTLWFLKQFIQKVSSRYMLNSFKMYPSIQSQCNQGVHVDYFLKVITKATSGYFVNETPEFFHISCNMHTPWGWATHWEFFFRKSSKMQHNVSGHVLNDFFESLMLKIGLYWEYIVITLKRAWWGHCDCILRTFWKNSQWVAQPHGGCMLHEIVKELKGSIHKVATGLPWWLLFESNQHVPLITLWLNWWYFLKEFSVYLLDTFWIHCFKKSQWNHNVSAG